MRVQILRRNAPATPSVSELRRRIELMLAAAGMPEAEVSVLLTGDEEMRALNRDWRGVDASTDVLSFSQTEGEFGGMAGRLLGDVAISIDTARRQAAERGHSLQKELDILLAHGILHLAGYDHEKSEKDARAMRALETKILRALDKPETKG